MIKDMEVYRRPVAQIVVLKVEAGYSASEGGDGFEQPEYGGEDNL
jgi:hypothetical protein